MSFCKKVVKTHFLGTVTTKDWIPRRKHSMNNRSLHFCSPIVFGQIDAKYVFDDNFTLTSFFGISGIEHRINVDAPIQNPKGWRAVFVDAETFSDDDLSE